MTDKFNYISDAELEQLIARVEQEELVAAPPDLMDNILEAVGTRKQEFRMYCFRVITSVAAAVALVFVMPELTDRMNLKAVPVAEPVSKSDVVEMIPVQAEVVKTVPDKDMVVAAKPIPSKEEVLNKPGLLEKVISDTTEWFNKASNNN